MDIKNIDKVRSLLWNLNRVGYEIKGISKAKVKDIVLEVDGREFSARDRLADVARKKMQQIIKERVKELKKEESEILEGLKKL